MHIKILFSKIALLIILICTISCNNKVILKSPNFILILSDDQGWNGTSFEMISGSDYSKSDYYETPNIESLAKSGMVFLVLILQLLPVPQPGMQFNMDKHLRG